MPAAAVITADIVNSTRLSGREERKLVNTISSILAPHKHEFYRGDSFQAYIKDAATALMLVLRSRAAAKQIGGISMPLADIRSSIGIGQVTTPVRELGTAKGEAFVLSGRSFDKLDKFERRTIIQSGNRQLNPGFEIIADYSDSIFRRLTIKQAAVVGELLAGRTQTEIAGKFRKSQSTINKHAKSAGWAEIDNLLRKYRQMVHLL